MDNTGVAEAATNATNYAAAVSDLSNGDKKAPVYGGT